MKYVALFRGINVGKSIQVPMKDLQQTLENLQFTDVSTYLNSGNALFNSKLGKQKVSELIEIELESQYKVTIPVLVKTAKEIIQIAESIPKEWNNDKTQQTYVAYMFKDYAYPELIDELPIKKDYMSIFYQNECIVWNIKREFYNKSQITKIVNHPAYIRMTTRNSNTARKLAELCQ
jgi:uncharacterized protein (DUF1697 family)